MKKILILTQFFPPEFGAPQTRLYELAKNLLNFGWEIDVLTAFPNYPIGKIFDGYKGKKYLIENLEGIKVLRTWIFPTISSNIFKRLLWYFSFTISSMYYGKKILSKPDIIYMESPPLFLGYSALNLSKFWKSQFILNLSDIWPEAFVTLGKIKKNSIYYKLMKKLELKLYERAEKITCQTKGIYDHIKEIFPQKEVKIVTNGVDIKRFGKRYFDENLRKELGWEEKYVFVYAGLFGVSQGLEQVIKLAEILKENNKILFSLIGDGPEKEYLVNKARILKLNNVQFLSFKEREIIPKILASSDAALIPLKVNIKEAVPSKIYEAMASELPVIVMSEGEAAEIIKKFNGGISVPPQNIEKLVEAVLYLYNNPEKAKEFGRNGRMAVETYYDREKISKELSDLMRS